MVAAGMRDPRGCIAIALLCALFAVACGDERQDADAPSGQFDLDVIDASFPAKQRIAEPSTLKLEVENTGDRTVPDLTVTLETDPGQEGQAPVAFGQSTDDPTLAASARPVWIVDEGPSGGETAYTNTWTVGPLGEGQSRTVEWKLTAATAGTFKVNWRLSPALEGDVSLGDGRTDGAFDVTITDDPVPSRVGADGEVVRGEEAGR
jgi:hypothetical protein